MTKKELNNAASGDLDMLEEDNELMENKIRKDTFARDPRLTKEVREKRKNVSREINNLLFQVDFFSDKRFML
jgi:hypothetical protein